MEHLGKDVKRTNLSELHVLPTLVDGKVVVINSDKTYTMYKPFVNADMSDGFDPIEYDLCQADFYTTHHVYELRWDNTAGKHVKTWIRSEKHHQYTTHRIGNASTDNKRIAKARRQEKLINELYQDQLAQKACEKTVDPSVYNLRVDDNIHIKSRQGIYRVVNVDYYTITVTCNKWSHLDEPNKIISKSDFKCYAGRLWNMSRTIKL